MIPEIELKKHPYTGELVPEIWKDVAGFEGLYEISNYGRLKSLPRFHKNRFSGYITGEHICKGKVNKKGYLAYELSKDCESKMLRTCRLVAIHFIENTYNKDQVNHKDGDKRNDFVCNLEWATQSENMQHSYDFLGRKGAYKGRFGKHHNQSKPVMSVQDVAIIEFESKTECSKYFGVTVQAIYSAVKKGSYCKGHLIHSV